MPRPFGGVRQQRGWWQAYYPGTDGRRVHETTRFTSAEAAREWLDDLAAERERGSWSDPAAAHQRFDVYATTWLSTAQIAPTTKSLYAGYLDNHLLPTFGLLELGQIHPALVRSWYAQMEAKAAPTARARSYALLRQVLNVAVDDGAIVVNPCRIKGGSVTRHKVRAMPDLEQARQIAALLPDRWQFLVHLAVMSTARYGELVALRRRDVDVLRMTVSVERQWYRGSFRDTKRPASERVIHLPKTMRPALEAHLAAFAGPGPEDLVFPTRNGTPPPNNWIDALVKRAAAQIGLEGVTFHAFRDLGGTLAAQTGASTKEIMRRMGQSTPRAAMLYQRAADERDEAIADRIAAGSVDGARVLPLPDRSPRSGRADLPQHRPS
ncbi:tyrosine-type recombinase/integrase [Cellulomonas endophytica]|uniref:tyrosine-type recombinase/integrase n=1 Tax=Cellulomonas endophytica TaxID=2494735 RepID=UPI001011DB4F|nr:tyrosine-type recombinase/integrase [Cellulomonas endophytica]